MEQTKKCPMCNSETSYSSNYDRGAVFYACPVCGRYEISSYGFNRINHNHLSSYLVHNRFTQVSLDYRYHTDLAKEICDKYKKEFEQGNIIHGHPVHMNSDIVENWYPKTFSERVDYIMLFLNTQIKHIGQKISMGYHELLSVFFIDRKEYEESMVYDVGTHKARNNDDCIQELQYMLDYLAKCSFVEYNNGPDEEEWVDISILPEGYARIDVLQKNTAHGRNALVAMKFGDDTIPLREAIRKGITDAGYIAVFIDEVQHNDFITPELLKHIRDSRFVVVDLTHQNNGAYFEEGYAMGLGKPVIQLCKKDTRLHFDIAQKNTIMWEVETDISERLANRIKATID
jgi:nucleoside 2-deoxyribosyltransferase